MKKTLLYLIVLQVVLSAKAQVITFDLADRSHDISPDLFGIFFEEINHGGEGGLYGEAIVNRSFDDDWGSFYGWSSELCNCKLVQDNLLNAAQRNAMQVTFQSSSGWVRNSGFDGIKAIKGTSYDISFWVRTNGEEYGGDIIARLVDASGRSCGSVSFPGPFDGNWRKCVGVIKGTADVNKASFQLKVTKSGTLVFDMVSCFPPTFKNRPNGMRLDLAQMLADMKPAFMRFPGGCYVEGRTGWANDPNNSTRWEWKKTIGPVEERPGHRNQQWGYWVSDGMGYHEFLQFCEDIDAAPMFVANVGMGHGWMVDYQNIGEYIQEVLDAIEYAIGDSTTTWGRKRAQNGHPMPFAMKYVELGNENCNYDFNSNGDQSDHYFERYIAFYNAIKAQYPDVITIGNVEAWGTDFPSWRSNYPVELVDEHYYRNSDFYFNNYEKYNSYSRAGAKVYVGEYAANQGGGIGTLTNALSEAVFMQGMENNSDVVRMSSFAPIFMNETYGGWDYDIIRFNNYMSYGIPSYYVQKMFGNNQGKQSLRWKEENNKPQLSTGDRRIGVGTWNTTATFSDVLLTDTTGNVLFSQKDSSSAAWSRGTGTWAYVNGTIRQTNVTAEGATFICNNLLDNENVNLSLKATKTGGTEGFLVIFNYKDAQNYTWWNLGGWSNSACGLENCINGTRSTVTRIDKALVTNKQYDIRIEKRKSHVRCFLDGTLIHDTEIPAGYGRGVYTSAAIDDEAGVAFIKLTNPNANPMPVTLRFLNGTVTGAEHETLTSEYGTDINTTADPTHIVPKIINDFKIIDGNNIEVKVPALSFNILRVRLTDVQSPQEVELPAPALSYSFESGQATDDGGRYKAALVGGAEIVQMTDGNHVLYTGDIGRRGFLNLGTEAIRKTFTSTGDYSISIDVLNRTQNNLGSYSWALALSNGTSQYLGLINRAGGKDWYFEIKNGQSQSLTTGGSMCSGRWHNMTFVQKDGRGYLYLDGYLSAQGNVDLQLATFVSSLNGCYVARSPFSGDAYMENACFDNVRFFRTALTDRQVASISRQTATMADDECARLNLPVQFEALIKEVSSVEKYADSRILSAALAKAKAYTPTAMASAEIMTEMRHLSAALTTYKDGEMSKAASGKEANLSFLIRNAIFNQGGLGWAGTEMTAVDRETAEQFNKNYDNYQILRGLPSGTYRLVFNAFYRAGAIEQAYRRWNDTGRAANIAHGYVRYTDGGESVFVTEEIPNLYASDRYTYSPYTYPDNLAAASEALNSADNDAYTCSLQFEVKHDGTEVRIGIEKSILQDADWTAFDNFRLYYQGLSDGIEDISATGGSHTSTSSISAYDLQGRRVDVKTLRSSGILIVNGRKILVR